MTIQNAINRVAIANVNIIELNSSTTYTPPANLVAVQFEAVGGGGGTGGPQPSAANQIGSACGGGGSGSYCRGIFSRAQVAPNVVITIGARGTAGTAGTAAALGGNGGTGGTTTIGALMSAGGGQGSAAQGRIAGLNQLWFTSYSGVSNPSTGGDVQIFGTAGKPGMVGNNGAAAGCCCGGDGGNSFYLGAGIGRDQTGVRGERGGGGGSSSSNIFDTTLLFAGETGGGGRVYITEWLN